MRVVQIQPLDLAVDFQRHAVPATAASITALMSNRSGSRLQQPPSGRMAEHVDPRALERAQHPVGHLRLVLREVRVDRGDDDVELGEAVVGEIEPAVGEDVALDAGQQRQALEAAVQRADAGGVLRARAARRGRWPWPAPCCDR